jgi:3-dehydro-L-gulonate 2-dehydrogenase
MPTTINITPEVLKKILYQILIKNKFKRKKADVCAEIFTNNTVDGIYTHGINRFPRFIQYVQNGFILPDAQPTIIHRFRGVEQWDGNLGPGPANAAFITNRTLKLAQKYGIGCVALCNTNHWMRGGAYGWQAAKQGFVFIGWTNTTANMPAWGAVNPKLGNNPVVFAVPFENEAIVLDMAMSQYSFGAMEMAVMKGENLSVNGGFDTNGNLSNDPEKILASWRSLPIGYWKGAGLALLLDVLSTILSNGLSTHEISKKPAEMACSQVFIAIDLSKFSHHSTINQTIKSIIVDYKSSLTNNESKKVTYPGERVIKARSINTREGIPVLESVWNEVLDLL